jgi:hypothetical protein
MARHRDGKAGHPQWVMPPPHLTALVSSITCVCLDLRSVWSIDHEPHDGWGSRSGAWRLLAFGDSAALRRLRGSDNLKAPGIELLVVVDGDRYATAWGSSASSGSLARAAWRRTAEDEAYYDESQWVFGGADGTVVRTRRKAMLVWQALDAALV